MPTFQNFEYSFPKLKAGILIFACKAPLPVQPEQVDEKKFRVVTGYPCEKISPRLGSLCCSTLRLASNAERVLKAKASFRTNAGCIQVKRTP